jgi:hypothetical protein
LKEVLEQHDPFWASRDDDEDLNPFQKLMTAERAKLAVESPPPQAKAGR